MTALLTRHEFKVFKVCNKLALLTIC